MVRAVLPNTPRPHQVHPESQFFHFLQYFRFSSFGPIAGHLLVTCFFEISDFQIFDSRDLFGGNIFENYVGEISRNK